MNKIIIILISVFLIYQLFCKNIYKEKFVSIKDELTDEATSSSVSVNYFESEKIDSKLEEIKKIKKTVSIEISDIKDEVSTEINEIKNIKDKVSLELNEIKDDVSNKIENLIRINKQASKVTNNILNDKNKLINLNKELVEVESQKQKLLHKDKPSGLGNVKFQLQKGSNFYTIKKGFFKKDNWKYDKRAKAWKVDLVISDEEKLNGFIVKVDDSLYKFKNKIFYDKLNKEIENPFTIIKDNVLIKRFYLKLNFNEHNLLPTKFEYKMTNVALRVNSGKFTGQKDVCLTSCKKLKFNENISDCRLKNIGDKGYNYGFCCKTEETELECRNRLGNAIDNYDNYEKYAVPFKKNLTYALKCKFPSNLNGEDNYDCKPSDTFRNGICKVEFEGKEYKALCCPDRMSKEKCESRERKMRNVIDFKNIKDFSDYIIEVLKDKDKMYYQTISKEGKLLLISYLLESRQLKGNIFDKIFDKKDTEKLIKNLKFNKILPNNKNKKILEKLLKNLFHFENNEKKFDKIEYSENKYNHCLEKENKRREKSLSNYIRNKKKCLISDDIKYNLFVIISNFKRLPKNDKDEILNNILNYLKNDLTFAKKLFGNNIKKILKLF